MTGNQHLAHSAETTARNVQDESALDNSRSDIDFGAAMLTVQRTVAYVDKEWQFTQPKTRGSSRSLKLPDNLVGVLISHREKASATAADDLMFPNTNGRPLDLRNVTQRHFKNVLENAGLSTDSRL